MYSIDLTYTVHTHLLNLSSYTFLLTSLSLIFLLHFLKNRTAHFSLSSFFLETFPSIPSFVVWIFQCWAKCSQIKTFGGTWWGRVIHCLNFWQDSTHPLLKCVSRWYFILQYPHNLSYLRGVMWWYSNILVCVCMCVGRGEIAASTFSPECPLEWNSYDYIASL